MAGMTLYWVVYMSLRYKIPVLCVSDITKTFRFF